MNTDEEPLLFKAQLYALTGVQPERQKVMCKGLALKDTEWNFQLKEVSVFLCGTDRMARYSIICNSREL